MHYGRQVPVHVRRRVPDETHSIVAWQTQIVLVLLVFREFRALPIRRWHWFVDFSNCSDDIFIQQYIRESCLLMLVRYPTRKSFRSVHAYVRACVRAVRGLREAVWHFWFLFLFLLLELAVLAGLVGSLVSSLVDSLVDSLVCSIVGGLARVRSWARSWTRLWIWSWARLWIRTSARSWINRGLAHRFDC